MVQVLYVAISLGMPYLSMTYGTFDSAKNRKRQRRKRQSS